MGQAGETNEKTRLCPSCRMEISVLAVKCRFCGESVGRPRDETRSLTIDDLGGETIRHYAPSSSVMEAMEAFRSEHEFKSNPPEEAQGGRKSLFGMAGKKKTDSTPPEVGQGLPQLDERSQALASLVLPASKPTGYKKPKGPTMGQRLVQVGGILVGIIVLGAVGSFAYKHFTAVPPEPARVKRNPAEDLMARGADPAQAVVEAAKALRQENHSRNREILAQAHTKFSEKVHGLLNAKPWTQQALRDANRDMNEVFKYDSSDEIRKLKEEVDAETFAYQMSLLTVDEAAKEASFGLSQALAGSGERTVKVKAGEIIAGRFKLIAVKRDKVQIEDTQRANRPLTFKLNDATIESP